MFDDVPEQTCNDNLGISKPKLVGAGTCERHGDSGLSLGVILVVKGSLKYEGAKTEAKGTLPVLQID